MAKDHADELHTRNGNYGVADLVPSWARDLTLEQLLALLVSRIVSRPDDVEIIVVNSSRIKVIEFDVHPDDRAQFLGRAGSTIRAIRTISKAVLGPLTKEYSYRVDMTHDDASRHR